MSIISRTTPKIRHAVPDLSKCTTGVDSQKVSQIAKTLTGECDLDLVRDKMIERYAQVIVPMKDQQTGVTVTEVYRANSMVKMDVAAQLAILAGQQEIVRMYLFNSIVRQRATLFSEPSQRYEYEDEATGETIGEIREDGGCNLAAQRWDSYADGCGSCVLYISDAGGVINYSEIPPSRFWYGFAETILDGGMDRPTNTSDIDEASVVCIELAPNGEKRKFAAWFGPCDTWPDGRHVVYTGQNWHDVPDVGAESAYEYSASANGFIKGAYDVANPLTLIARSQGAEGSTPVYPLVVLYGDSMQGGLLPTTSSLYDTCAELDLMGSMVLGAAGRGARGAKVMKRGTDTSVPDQVDEGLVLLGREQELLNVGWPASHSRDAMDVISAFCRWIAEAHNVPGFLVADDRAGEVPSGVALEMMCLPLTRNRNARIELNKHSVARRFGVERLIINGAVGTDVISYDERETWHAGERKWPVDPMQSLMTWEKRIAMREADLGDVVMEMRSLNTHEEAMNWLEEREAIRADNKILQPASAPAVKPGLAQRLQGGALQRLGTGSQDRNRSEEGQNGVR